MSHDGGFSELAEIYTQNRRKMQRLEHQIFGGEISTKHKYYRMRPDAMALNSAADLGRDIMERFMSIKHRIVRVCLSIRAMKQIADSLHSSYTMDIVPARLERDDSIKTMIESKLTTLQMQNKRFKTVISRLTDTRDELIDRKQQLDNRITELRLITKLPIDDLQMIEDFVKNMEAEDNALNEHMNQPEDVDVNVDGIIIEQEMRSKTHARRMMIEKRLQEIQQEKEELESKFHPVIEAKMLSFHNEEPSYDANLTERYQCFAQKQEELDREEMEINQLVSANTQERQEIQQKFQEKLDTISKLTEANVERDKLMFEIHEMNDRQITLKETLLVLTDNTRRLRRNQVVSESLKVSNTLAEQNLAESRQRISEKMAMIETKDKELIRKRQRIERMRDNFDLLSYQFHEREKEIESLEAKEQDLENKCDQVSQDIKLEADQFDYALFEASVSRADSRVQRFQALLNSKTEQPSDDDDSDSSGELTDLLRQASLVVQTPSRFSVSEN